MTSSWKNNCALVYSAVMVGALSFAAFAHLPGSPQPRKVARVTVNSKAPQFTLVDQNGQAFRSERLHGKVTVLTFIFTTCPDVCPLLTANFAQLQRSLNHEGIEDFFLVSITTDPEVDKPDVLKSYAQRFGADLNTWAFLTGSEEKMQKVWKSFGV